MKTRISGKGWFLCSGAASLMVLVTAAATKTADEIAAPASDAAVISTTDSAPTPAETLTTTAEAAPQAPADTAPAKLPYGTEDVLRLSRAQISEDITLNYIQNAGTAYSLTPKDIVYLRNEGVSDRVINAMIDQRKKVDAGAQAALQAQAPAMLLEQPPEGMVAGSAPMYAQPAPVFMQPPPVCVAPEPESAPSTVYVIPYPAPAGSLYRYPTYYPSYGFGRSYGCSSVVVINGGYGGGRGYATAGYRHGGGGHHGVYRFGHR